MSDEVLPDEMLRHFIGSGFIIEKPKKLAVAVSGGGDSMACLDLMLAHGRDSEFPVEAVTVDHGLRPEAADEIALVAAYCADRGVRHSVLDWSWDGTGNLQAEARAARYGLIAAWAKERGVDWVALGHTQDDVAETFLMRLARRSGVDGLAQMEHRFKRDGVTWTRPLLNAGRADLRDYLRRHGIKWAEDPSNEDPEFERVKARSVLAALAPLGIDADVLADVSHNLWVSKSALDHVMRDVVYRYVAEDRGDLILPTEHPEVDRIIPSEIIFRLRRAAIRWVGGADYPPRSDAMIELDMGLREQDSYTLGGCRFHKMEGEKFYQTRWRISREFNAVKDVITKTDALWDGRWRLDGPHDEDLEIRALGEAVSKCPDWRDSARPRAALMASPSIWRGDSLIAAPLAGFGEEWSASATGRGTFAAFLHSR
ncbi:MAG: tRNA lysidine(34) synthetase TilS [Paracoccaceae bacterium]|nr:tRNA lysidine(34) synthetase TilS [Paracoccaceae bacterium]